MLFHITSKENFPPAGGLAYRAPSLASEGFIHLSYGHQRRLTQQRYYQNQADLVLLTIDPAHLAAPLRVENGFPHLYGPLEPEAVVEVTPLPAYRDLTVGLLSAVFPDDFTPSDLLVDLGKARQAGASLVILPELPCNPWSPADRVPRDLDLDSGRSLRLSEAARLAEVALLGGVIEGYGDPATRRNVARLWGPQGQPWLRYEKLHLPHEPGFWETHHYGPGQDCPLVSDECGFPLGIQICSDANRPFGAMALRAQGAGAILIPRATEKGTFHRWRRTFQSLAQMTACYVISVNRPAPELGVPLGGPSLVVGPDGEVLAEGEERLLTCRLEHSAIVKARESYPGYLEVPAAVYARAWDQLKELPPRE